MDPLLLGALVIGNVIHLAIVLMLWVRTCGLRQEIDRLTQELDQLKAKGNSDKQVAEMNRRIDGRMRTMHDGQ